MKLKRILVTAFLGVLMVLTCFVSAEKDSEKLYSEMPDIVFVAVYSNTSQSETIGTSGYYIEKDGTVKSFYLDERLPFDGDYSKIDDKLSLDYEMTIEDFSSVFGLDELHKKIQANSVNCGSVSRENVIDCYRTLLKINEKSTLYAPEVTILMIVDEYRCYGVRLNENNEEEYVIIEVQGNSFWKNDTNQANRLYEQLTVVYPELSFSEMYNKYSENN